MWLKPAAGRAKSPVIQLFEAKPEEADDLTRLDAYKGIFPDAETAAPMARPSAKSRSPKLRIRKH